MIKFAFDIIIDENIQYAFSFGLLKYKTVVYLRIR